MTITCEQCQTQFQLDDSRIPERGARVRCSRCKHAFFVKPASEAGDPVDHAVEQALAEDEEQRAGSTQELGPAAALRGEAEEESDWEFNDDSSDLDPDLTAARELVDDLLDSVDEAPSSEEADDGLLGAQSDVDVDVDVDLDVDTDVDEDIDSLLDSSGYDADLTEPEPAAFAAEEPAAAFAEPEPESAAPSATEEPAAPPPEQTAARATEEELGSPENWDFFSEEQDGSLSEETGFEQTPIGQVQLAPQPTFGRPPVDVDAEPSKTGQRLQHVAQAAGWLCVALLVIGGLHSGIVAERAGPPAIRTAQVAGGLEATGVEGRWFDNAAAGPIYVISGELLRVGSRPAVPGAWLAVRLFDENGVLLLEEAAAAGPVLPEARLREDDPRALRAAQAQGALAMAGAALMPGDTWAFQAILNHLPEAASRFDLAAIPVEAAPPVPEMPRTEVP